MSRKFQTQDSVRQRSPAAETPMRKDARPTAAFEATPAQLRINHIVNNSAQVKNLDRVAQLINAGDAVQRKTEITHTSNDVAVDLDGKSQNFKVGRKMEALLDVTDPVIGTATGANWTWMQALRKKYPDANVVRGHLLNHDLGGFSNPENLYPISTEANANHSAKVEQEVKRRLNDDQAKKDRIQYDVEVIEENEHNPKESTFRCTYGWEKDGMLIEEDIVSNLGADEGKFKGSGSEKAHDAWAHGKGRGTSNRNNETVDDYSSNFTHVNTSDKNTTITGPIEAVSKFAGGEMKRLLKSNFGYEPTTIIKDELDAQGIGDDELDVSDVVFAMMEDLETFKISESKSGPGANIVDAIKKLIKNLHKAG